MALTAQQNASIGNIGRSIQKIRQALALLNDDMSVYVNKGYGTPVDQDLIDAGYDFTGAELLTSVQSVEELNNFMVGDPATLDTHGAILDIVRII